MNELGSKLRLAYYVAPDGPRIILFGPLDAQFEELRILFEHLADGSKTVVSLHQQPFVVAFGGIEITLSVLSLGADKISNGVHHKTENAPIYNWSNQRQKWTYYANLVDGLLKTFKPCHQYLSSYPQEDAIVVISKGEYRDDVLNRG